MFQDDKNKIEELKKTLYSRQNYKPDNPIHDLPKKTYEVKNSWTTEEDHPISQEKTDTQTDTTQIFGQKPKKRWALGKIFMWFSIIFFVVAVLVAGFIYYNGYNTISADNVDIVVSGPSTIDAGRVATLSISIDNKNQIALQEAYLNIEYPEGSRRDPSQTDPLVQERILIGDIASGEHLDRTISAVFFGLQGKQQKIKISLEYHVLGSLSSFAKNKDYFFTLGAGPISMVVEHVQEINSGQDISFSVVVTSNSTAVLSNLALKANYPFGFTFKSATPASTLDNTVWKIGNLAPGESKKITIVGNIEGQENEQRAFKFNVGIGNPADQSQISTTFFAGTETVLIQKPFIGLNLALNNNTDVSVPTFAGETVSGRLMYSNNTARPLTDAKISIKLDGIILDKDSVIAPQGFYQSANNTITWDSRSLSSLDLLSPGDQGTVQFNFKTLQFAPQATFSRSSQKVTLATNVTATQVSADGAKPVSSSILHTAVINSDMNLLTTATYSGDSIVNSGPIPPKAEQTTTYTINWTILNTFNNLSNVIVTATLPSYVKFSNNFVPANENVTFDESTGEVWWNVGNIKTSTGYFSAPRKVSFQVSILPSLSQVGTVPTLVEESKMRATDTFTNDELFVTSKAVTTDLSADEKYGAEKGSVVK